MRLFLAIELPDPVRAHLAQISEQWKGARRGIQRADADPRGAVSWVRAHNLHLTLKFFGNVTDQSVPRLCEALKNVETEGPMRLWPDRIECFPERGPVRVIAAGIGADEGKLILLHRRIEEECEPLGDERERRRYRPHVTLGRCKDPLPPHTRKSLGEQAIKWLPGPEFEASEFVLMESRLKPEGAEYVPLARFALK